MNIITSQTERLAKWFAARQGIEYCYNESYVYTGLERNGELIAVVMYNNYYRNGSIQMHLVVDGMGNKEMLWYAYHYPFIELKVNKIIATIQKTNKKALKMALNAGFTLEHEIQNGGIDCNLLILSMTKDKCRFLRG